MVHSILFGSIWSHSILFSSFSPLKFYSVQFGPFSLIQSIESSLALFSPHWSYFVHFSLLRSTQSIFSLLGPHWSYSVHSVHFDPRQSYSGHLVHYGLIRFILYTLVLFGPFCPLRSYSIHSTIQSSMSTLILFGPVWSHWVHSIYFGLIQSY